MKAENMLFLTKSLFVLFFCFFASTLSAQPVASGSNGDYCECLEGIQGPDEYCPPLPCPPSGNNNGGIPPNNTGGPNGGTPSPSGNTPTGGTNTEIYDSMIESVFCMMFPHMCP